MGIPVLQGGEDVNQRFTPPTGAGVGDQGVETGRLSGDVVAADAFAGDALPGPYRDG